MDSYGVISGFNYKNQQWIPLLDLKEKFTEKYDMSRIWIVGLGEKSLMFIELAKDQIQPHESLKSKYKKIDLHVPMLIIDSDTIDEKKDQDLPALDEQHFREQVIFDHEQ